MGTIGAMGTAAALLVLVLPLAPLGLAGCGRPRPPGPDVVAKIGDGEIRYAQFEAYLRRAVGDGSGEGDGVLASDALSGLFDQFLDEELLARLAADRGLALSAPSTPAAGAAESAAGRRRTVERLLESVEAEPSEAEIAAWYRAHRQEFARPERVRLRQILTDERAAAESAVRELAAGADFAELARRISRDPSAASGGEQGELARGDLPPAFAEVIFALRPGEVSRLVPADYGFHVFQVTERLPAEVVPLPQVRGEIAERLRRERADRRLRELVEEARNEHDVTVYERNLPFNYKGFYGHDKPTPSP
jgi:hypothetical protein